MFILGVYPSAFHAAWYSPEGTRTSPAIAVADEPEPFWNGAGRGEILQRVATRVPPEAGSLAGAGDNNGRAGRTLDEVYLDPLGVGRDDAWIADIQNYYLASDGQVERLRESYEPLVDAGVVPAANLIPRSSRRSLTRLAENREPALEDEWAEAEPDWLITLGDEPVAVLGLTNLREGAYGQPRRTRLLGRDVWHLALVHTRQAGGHGGHSVDWKHRHAEWGSALRDDPPAWVSDLRA